ncbi:hypothetical protein MRB53_011870 [Persea americana]|uniref:Uncharacterized protein n=1 Tax=Persea americana TaxID=3435 RepID=A0ACC2LWL2_PERAE|nr:hypothetical protein MRB53_011870 [Persea americana]
MEIQFFLGLVCATYLIIVFPDTCTASTQSIGQISPPFGGSQMNWIDNQGLFLLSKSSKFAFGFYTAQDVTSFLLGIIHVDSSRVVWTANRGSPVTNSDTFMFGNDGNAYLESGSAVVWSTNTSGKGAASMELQDSGNLVLLGNDSRPLWQSFGNPTDTLLSDQNFTDGMKLISSPNSNNLSFYLEFESGDPMFYANFQPPQPYWSMQGDTRKTINKVSGDIYSVALGSNSWQAYDQSHALIWQFIFSQASDPNITWAAVLGNDGSLSFFNLENGGQGGAEQMRIPQDSCQTPEYCGPYSICYSNNRCQCPAALNFGSTCNAGTVSQCSSNSSVEYASIGDGIGYFAIDFVSPIAESTLTGCKQSCMTNCSCVALFFDEKSGKCFLFDNIGSLRQSDNKSAGYVSFVKISSSGTNNVQEGSSGKKRFPIVVVIIVLTTLVVIAALICLGVRHMRRKKLSEPSQASSEEDTFLENLSGMPVRFSYRELQTATNNFSVKLGQGGKNFVPAMSSEKAHFPSYAFKMMEEGKMQQLLDAKIQFDEKDERVRIAIKVALWCIQEDMHLRPSMTKVVQMLEGLSDVPQPPVSSQLGFRLYSNFLKSVSEEGTSSGQSDYNSTAILSAVRLSGPR